MKEKSIIERIDYDKKDKLTEDEVYKWLVKNKNFINIELRWDKMIGERL